MKATALLAPVFVQVALTFGLLLWMGTLRVRAVRGGLLHPRDIALGERVWPTRILQVQNAYHNQFELPVLFYAVVALVILTGRGSPPMVSLAWLFVFCRLVHALIHTTTNNVPRRFFAFVGGMVVLGLMWLFFAWSVVAT